MSEPTMQALLREIAAHLEVSANEVWSVEFGYAETLRKAAATLDGMERDRARLDWWEAQRTRSLAPVMDAEGWRLHEADHLRPLPVPFRRTLRSAIDAARAALPESGGGR